MVSDSPSASFRYEYGPSRLSSSMKALLLTLALAPMSLGVNSCLVTIIGVRPRDIGVESDPATLRRCHCRWVMPSSSQGLGVLANSARYSASTADALIAPPLRKLLRLFVCAECVKLCWRHIARRNLPKRPGFALCIGAIKNLPISLGVCQRSVMVRQPRCSFRRSTSCAGIQGAHKSIRCFTFWSAHAGARLATQTSWKRWARPIVSSVNTPLGKRHRQSLISDPYFKHRSFSVFFASPTMRATKRLVSACRLC